MRLLIFILAILLVACVDRKETSEQAAKPVEPETDKVNWLFEVEGALPYL